MDGPFIHYVQVVLLKKNIDNKWHVAKKAVNPKNIFPLNQIYNIYGVYSGNSFHAPRPDGDEVKIRLGILLVVRMTIVDDHRFVTGDEFGDGCRVVSMAIVGKVVEFVFSLVIGILNLLW